MHLVASTFNPPSAVICSLSCSFHGSDNRYLVLCKTDKLEIHALLSHGTELVCEQDIWGAPKGLAQLEASKHIVLALDVPKAQVIILEFEPRSTKLRVHHTSNISPLTHQPSVRYSGFIASNQVICAAFYNGHIKQLEVEAKNPYKVTETDLRVHELTIQTMCFTLPASNGVVAIVYTDQRGQGRLIGRSVNGLGPDMLIPDRAIDTQPDLVVPVEIQNPSGDSTFAILLFADTQVTFINTSPDTEQTDKGKMAQGKKKSKSDIQKAIQGSMVTAEVPFRSVAAWIQVDGSHLVVGDPYGTLYLLTMAMKPEFTLNSTPLGKVSVPTTLSYLSNNIIYVGSSSAPSQLVRLFETIQEPTPANLSKKKNSTEESDGGEYLEIMLNHNENIAPILDALLVDGDGSGQPRIAAVSGDDAGGSLHIIHRGASFQELAVLDGLTNLENLFALKKYYGAADHAYLAATTATGTFLFSLTLPKTTFLTPSDLPGISRTSRTLLLTNLDLPGMDAVVHVTPNQVTVTDLITGRNVSSWNPSGEITAAALDAPLRTVCVATAQGSLFCLGIQAGGIVKQNNRSFTGKPHFQIAALAINKNMILASFWGSNETVLMSLPDLKPLQSPFSTEPSAVNSIHLTNFGKGQTHAIMGRLDGALVIQVISSDGTPLPNTRRVIPLGGSPISIASIPSQGDAGMRVVAAGQQAVVLSLVKNRFKVSQFPAKDVCAATALRAPGLESSIVYASPTRLVFGRIEQLDKLNIHSHKLGADSPSCLGHHPQLSAFVVGCTNITDSRPCRYFLRFLDDSTFKDLGVFKLQYLEAVSSIAPYSYGSQACIVVGTASEVSGRIMVYKSHEKNGAFTLESSKDVDGQVCAIKQFKERIIAAVNDRVLVFDLVSDKDVLVVDGPVAKWERAYSVEALAVRGEMIVVGDKIRSVSVLRLVEELVDAPTTIPDDDDMEIIEQRAVSVQLETVAMDIAAVWPSAVEILSDGKTIIAAQLDGNILTWELENGKLDPKAAFYMGELINKFIILPPRSLSSIHPIAFFVTNSGRIGMLSTVNDEDAVYLTRLELKMDNAIQGFGGVRHSDWRTPKLFSAVKRPPPRRGVTDGDFVKQFLELSDQEARRILSEGSAAERIGPAEEEQIRRCLEALTVDQ